ncbi:MAG: hypothetical protein QW779_06530, partial [Nitrososphaerales archaeon]
MAQIEALFLIDLIATFAPYMIVALSLNLEYGFCGIPNFGKTLSVAGGAFLVGFLPGRLAAQILGLDTSKYIENNAKIITMINNALQTNLLLSLSLLILTLFSAMV